MNRLQIIFFIVMLLVVRSGHSDQPAPNEEYTVTSANGQFAIHMKPAHKWRLVGQGTVYRASDSKRTPLWKVAWHAERVELSSTGEHLVRFGPWAHDLKDHTDLAIAFYHKDKLLKEHRVNELIKNPEALVYSVSHYTWDAVAQTLPNGFTGDHVYHLVMADKTAYDFDITTGAIIATGTDPAARTSSDIYREEHEAGRKLVLAALDRNNVKSLLETKFKIVDASPTPQKLFGKLDPLGPGVNVTMIPKASLGCRIVVEGCFKVLNDGTVNLRLKPEELASTLEAALANPFVIRQLHESANMELRLRIAADRMHLDEDKLASMLDALHLESTPALQKEWAYFTIRLDPFGSNSLYLNRVSGDVITIDEKRQPAVILLHDQYGTLKAQGIAK